MENNGRGIFYGVIGVATLVVAIIGATFAYFAASVNGTSGGAAANSANVAGTLTITENPDIRTSLIPTTQAIMLESFAQTGTKGQSDGKCNGVSKADGASVYDLCSVYQFTLNNSATMAQTVYINFATVSNNFGNLHYCVYSGTTATGTPAHACGAVPAAATPVQVATTSIGAGSSATYTVIMYVNETGSDQTGTDSGKAFTGTISASTSDGTNNVTGVIAGTGA